MVNTIVAQESFESNDMTFAHDWGKEDGIEGLRFRGSVYFRFNEAAYAAYAEGYGEGWLRRAPDTPWPGPMHMAPATDTVRINGPIGYEPRVYAPGVAA